MGNLFGKKKPKKQVDPPVYNYGNNTFSQLYAERFKNHSSSIYSANSNRSSSTSQYYYVINRSNNNTSNHSNTDLVRPSASKVPVVTKAKTYVTLISNSDFKKFQTILYSYIIYQSKYLNWDDLFSNKNYTLYDLKRGSIEFNEIETTFLRRILGEIHVAKIEKVQNPYLLGQYSIKKLEYVNKYLPVQEKSMYHGTKRQYIPSICKDNFNWRYHGKSKGNIFGKGVSFTPKASYANHYCDRQGTKIMIVAKVLVCNTCEGNPNMTIPDYYDKNRYIRYDTSIKIPKKDVYVKYCDDEFYPAYLIHYCGKMYYPNKGFYR